MKNNLWYKNKVYWIVIVVVMFLAILIADGASYHAIHKAYSTANQTATVTNTDKNETTDGKHMITVFDKKYKYSQKKTYQINKDDKSWSYADIHFNKVTIYKLAKAHQKMGDSDKKKASYVVVINLDIKANKDIDVYPDQATLSAGSSQGDAVYNDDFGDDDTINSGVSKNGNIVVPIDGVNSINDLKKFRLKFDGFASDDNDDSDDAAKTIDVQISLK